MKSRDPAVVGSKQGNIDSVTAVSIVMSNLLFFSSHCLLLLEYDFKGHIYI